MMSNGQLARAGHLAAAALGVYLCFRLALPFLAPLTWALALAIVLQPVHHRIERRFASPGAASLLTVAVSASVLGVLIVIVGQQVLREAASGADHMRELARRWDFASLGHAFPRAEPLLSWLTERFEPVETMDRLGQWLTDQSAILLRGSINQIVGFVLTFYFLFYLLRDGDRLLAGASLRLPARVNRPRPLGVRIAETVRATVRGTLLVALVQGSLGGLMFWLLGLPAPAFWGLVMGILAIVPVLGAFVVWLPAAILLALDGQWASALVLSVWGGVVIAGIDNLLYPVLVGTQLRLHTLAVFIGAVGGLVLFGAPGVILGPVIIVATQSLLQALPSGDASDAADTGLTAIKEAAAARSHDAGGSEEAGR